MQVTTCTTRTSRLIPFTTRIKSCILDNPRIFPIPGHAVDLPYAAASCALTTLLRVRFFFLSLLMLTRLCFVASTPPRVLYQQRFRINGGGGGGGETISILRMLNTGVFFFLSTTGPFFLLRPGLCLAGKDCRMARPLERTKNDNILFCM